MTPCRGASTGSCVGPTHLALERADDAARRGIAVVVARAVRVQAIGREVLKAGFLVFYRSIFDLVRELLSQETQAGEGRLLKKYLKPDLLIID